MDTLPPISKSAEPAITSYLAYLAKEGGLEKIHFLLGQYTINSCPIPKNLGDLTILPANIHKKWLESCLEELKSLKDRNVYEVVDLSKRRKATKNCQVFNIKSDGCYRSQIVVKGFSQIKGIDFDELFSSVVHYETVCLFLAITSLKDWDIHNVDVKTAYLYSDLDEEIYMEQPEGFRLPGKKKKV